jgi:hypothetical protein
MTYGASLPAGSSPVDDFFPTVTRPQHLAQQRHLTIACRIWGGCLPDGAAKWVEDKVDVVRLERNESRNPSLQLRGVDSLRRQIKEQHWLVFVHQARSSCYEAFSLEKDEWTNPSNKTKEVLHDSSGRSTRVDFNFADLQEAGGDGGATGPGKNLIYFGPPGTGKSSWTRKFIKSRKDAIVVFLDQVPSRSFLEKLESSTKDILKVFVFEEAVSLLEDSSDIREMLDFLDGSKTVSNAIYFLSTNYPDAIPENVIRNGRIDTFAYVDYPGESARQKLINLYLNRDGTSEEVKITDKMPIVDIREICFLHKKTNKSFSDCVKIIEEKHKMIKKHFGRTKEIRLT